MTGTLYFLFGELEAEFCVAQAGFHLAISLGYLDLMIPLLLLPKNWGYRCVPPCSVYIYLLENQTQDFVHARQALFQLSHNTRPTSVF